MGNTRDTGYLQNIVTFDANDNIVLPADLTIGGSNGFYWDNTNKLLGIGTNSPVKTLDVRGTLAISNSALSFWYMDRDDSDGRFKIVDDANNDRFNITTSGNLGLGVTPNAWGSPFVVSQYPYGSYFGGTTSGGTVMGNNNYYNGSSYIYQNSDYATQYQQGSGTHFWRISPSGTAGNPISFTQAMTLNSSGRLLLGTTSDNGARLQVTGAATFSSSVTAGGDIQGGGDLYFNRPIRTTIYPTTTNQNLHIKSNGSGTLQFNDDVIGNISMVVGGGNVGIGTTAPISTNLNSALTIYKVYNNDSSSIPSPNAQLYGNNQSGLYLFGRNSGLTIVGANNEENQIIFANSSTVAYASINTGTGSNSTGGDMYFKVGSNIERMRITSGGNVLIGGTSNPYSEKVYIEGGANLLTLSRPGAAKEYGFQISSGGNFILRDYTATSDRITLTAGGNVLIGTTTDNGQKLQISGNVNANGFNSISNNNSIPFTSWTTIATVEASTIGMYLVVIGLAAGGLTDWTATGILYSNGTTASWINGPTNGSLVQIRISGTAIQVYQNGTSPSINLSFKLLKVA